MELTGGDLVAQDMRSLASVKSQRQVLLNGVVPIDEPTAVEVAQLAFELGRKRHDVSATFCCKSSEFGS